MAGQPPGVENKMDEVAQPAPAPDRAGDRLRAAREAAGSSLAEIGQRTRIPLRHLEAIEQSDYASLPSHTYATGFAKAYARAVGADEVEIGRMVRSEIDRIGRRTPEYQPYVTADPARLPSRGLTAVALGLALAVAVLAGLWFATDLFRGGTGTTVAVVPPAVGPAPVLPSPTPAAPTGGQVVLTARDEVWMRVYDGADQTLYIGTLQPGERFEVPAGANRPMINVGRPDQLAVTLNGSAVPALGDGRRAIKDVVIDGAAMAARVVGQPAEGAPIPTTSPTPIAAVRPIAARSSPAPARRRAPLTETQRANLKSAADLRQAR